MAAKKDKQPDAWRPIEVSTERNGFNPAPIEVPVAVAPSGATAPAPKSGDAANDKES